MKTLEPIGSSVFEWDEDNKKAASNNADGFTFTLVVAS